MWAGTVSWVRQALHSNWMMSALMRCQTVTVNMNHRIHFDKSKFLKLKRMVRGALLVANDQPCSAAKGSSKPWRHLGFWQNPDTRLHAGEAQAPPPPSCPGASGQKADQGCAAY
jgi:hypothetical protein